MQYIHKYTESYLLIPFENWMECFDVAVNGTIVFSFVPDDLLNECGGCVFKHDLTD